MLPWFERPIIYDVRARPYEVNSDTGSHDLQKVCNILCVCWFTSNVLVFNMISEGEANKIIWGPLFVMWYALPHLLSKSN